MLRPCREVWNIFHIFPNAKIGTGIVPGSNTIYGMANNIIGKLRNEGFPLLLGQSIHLLYQQPGSASKVSISLAHTSPSFQEVV